MKVELKRVRELIMKFYEDNLQGISNNWEKKDIIVAILNELDTLDKVRMRQIQRYNKDKMRGGK